MGGRPVNLFPTIPCEYALTATCCCCTFLRYPPRIGHIPLWALVGGMEQGQLLGMDRGHLTPGNMRGL